MAKIRDGSTYLANHLTANDYYSEGERVEGEWWGKAAERMFIGGQKIGAHDACFEALRQNVHPLLGQRLAPRKVEDGVRAFDFQCSAQKSVSIAAIVGGDERLKIAHQHAVRVAFAELERFAACRIGTAEFRQTFLTGELAAAVFHHDASRALDPQLHTHCVVANVTWNEAEQKWKALTEFEMVKAIRYASKVYQHELAREVQRCGYEIEHVRNARGQIEGFEICGIDAGLRQKFSRRRAEVEAGIEKFRREYGREPTTKEIAVITRETRANKNLLEITTPEVRQRQIDRMSTDEKRMLTSVVRKAIANGSILPHQTDSAVEPVVKAVRHLFERESVRAGHEILAEALNQGLGAPSSIDEFHQALSTSVSRILPALDPAGVDHLHGRWATDEGISIEKELEQAVRSGANLYEPLGLIDLPTDWKSAEQRDAVLKILSNRDESFVLRGLAGAGKTTAVSEVVRGAEAAGRNIVILAPTGSAAEVLRSAAGGSFSQATTIADFLTNVRETRELNNSLIVVDEAGMCSLRDGIEILRTARQKGARLLWVGDIRQHTSVEAGDFLRLVETYGRAGIAELREIRRQQDPQYRSAVQMLADGSVTEGLSALDQLGWVREEKSAYLRVAAEEYLAKVLAGQLCIGVAPTWIEQRDVTRELRARMNFAPESVRAYDVYDSWQWTREQKQDLASYEVGTAIRWVKGVRGFKAGQTCVVRGFLDGYLLTDHGLIDPRKASGSYDVGELRTIEVAPGELLLLRRNDRDARLVNGQIVQVAEVHQDKLVLTDGRVIPPKYRDFVHGYFVTSHKSQGQTRDHVIIAAERLDAKAAYVACSRGRLSATICTPDKARLFSAAGQNANREAVLDQPEIIAPVSAADVSTAIDLQVKAKKVSRLKEFMRGNLDAWARRARHVASDIPRRWRAFKERLKNIWHHQNRE